MWRLKCEPLAASGHIPKCDGAVIAAAGECPAIGKEGESTDRGRMLADRFGFLAAGDCETTNPIVVAAGDGKL